VGALEALARRDLLIAIQELNAEFAFRIDQGDMESAADLFAEDGSYGRRGEAASVGRETIRGVYRALNAARRHTTRHLFSNFRITPESHHRARGSCVMVMYAAAGELPQPVRPVLVQDFHDLYCEIDGRWLFQSREAVRLFVDPDFTVKLPLGTKLS
jgi:ketosteroid isomerase-like protein